MGVFDGIGTAAAGSVLGLALQGMNDSRQLNQQQRLQNMQIDGQKQMAIFNREQAMQMWHDTNYNAQRKEMEKAGLNVGLMYGQGGGGGTTTSMPSANVGGAQAPQGGGEIGMGIQTGMQLASMELMNAQAEKAKAEAAKISGVDTEKTKVETQVGTQTIQNLIQDAKTGQAQEVLTRTKNRIEEINEYVQGETKDDATSTIKWQLHKIMAEAGSAVAKNYVDQNTANSMIEIAKANATGALLHNELTRANTNLTNAQIEEISAKIKNMAQTIDVQERHNKIEQFKAELKGAYPTMFEVIGNAINKVEEALKGEPNQNRVDR